MSPAKRYSVAAGLGLVVVGVLAFPYVQAQLRPIKPTPSPTPDSVLTNGSLKLGAPHHLSIPVLGIEAPIIYIDDKNETAYQSALKNGVVHYPGTALPGETGNVYIFGHSSDYVWSDGDYKTIFAKLPQIEMGTDIVVTDAGGNFFHYSVIETKVVGPRDMTVLDQGDGSRSLLTIQTSYPLGTALQRYIVVAELK